MSKRLTSYVLGTIVATFAVAAQPPALAPTIVEAERDEQPADEPVERLARAEKKRAPGNDLIIGRETIEDSGVTSVAQLLEDEAGLPFASYFGGVGTGTPVLRGFGENASSRVLVLVDGVPASRPDLGGTELLQFPLEGLEQVELLRGSRTVRYGSGALGGIISLRTRQGGDSLGVSGEVSYGSNNTRRGRLTLTSPLGESGWDVSLQGESIKSDGFRKNSATESDSSQFILRSPQACPLRLRTLVSYNNLFFENPGSLGRDAFYDDITESVYENAGVGSDYNYETATTRVSQLVEWDINQNLSLDLRGAWSRRDRMINFGAGSHSDNDLTTVNLEPMLTWESDSLSADLGMRFLRDDLSLDRYAEKTRVNLLSEAEIDRQLWGPFAIASVRLGGKWTLTGGIGWEKYTLEATTRDFLLPNDPGLNYDEEQSKSAFAFEAAIEYAITKNWDAWLRYDRTYRYPVTDEVAGYQGFELSENFNFDLGPSRGHNFELGIRTQQEAFDFALTGYGQLLDGEIAYDYRRNLNVNFAETLRFGAESRGTYRAEHWSATAYYNGTWAEFSGGPDEGERVPLIPRHTFGGAVTWEPSEDLAFTLGGRYVSSSIEGNDFTGKQPLLKSRAVWRAQARWQVNDSLSLFTRVDNLFDKRYASLKYAGQYYPAPGRTILAGLRFEF